MYNDICSCVACHHTEKSCAFLIHVGADGGRRLPWLLYRRSYTAARPMPSSRANASPPPSSRTTTTTRSGPHLGRFRRSKSPSTRKTGSGGKAGSKAESKKKRLDEADNKSVHGAGDDTSPRDVLSIALIDHGGDDDATTSFREILTGMHRIRQRRLAEELKRMSSSPKTTSREGTMSTELAKRTPPALVPLRCAVMTYEWGRFGADSIVGRLAAANHPTGFALDAKTTYAEMWMGTHANGPSMVDVEGHDLQRLDVYLSRSQGGATPVRLPFLFKVLAIRTALSIQAHPDKFLARLLHARQPDVYKDANHKPEMAIALTEFEALCSFMSAELILEHLGSTPE